MKSRKSSSKGKVNVILFGEPTENKTFIKRMEAKERSEKEIIMITEKSNEINMEMLAQDATVKDFLKSKKNDPVFLIPIKNDSSIEGLLEKVQNIRSSPSGKTIPILITSEFELGYATIEKLTANGIVNLGSLGGDKYGDKRIFWPDTKRILQSIDYYCDKDFVKNDLPNPQKVLKQIQTSIKELESLEADIKKTEGAAAKLDKTMLKSLDTQIEELENEIKVLSAAIANNSSVRIYDETIRDKDRLLHWIKVKNNEIEILSYKKNHVPIEALSESEKLLKNINTLKKDLNNLSELIGTIKMKGDKMTRAQLGAYAGQLQELETMQTSIKAIKSGFPSKSSKMSSCMNSVINAMKMVKEYAKNIVASISNFNIKGSFSNLKKNYNASKAESTQRSEKRERPEVEDPNEKNTHSNRPW